MGGLLFESEKSNTNYFDDFFSTTPTFSIAEYFESQSTDSDLDIFQGFSVRGGFLDYGNEDILAINLEAQTYPIEELWPIGKPSIYVGATGSLEGEFNQAHIGLNWKITPFNFEGGDRFYVKPGLGLMFHDGNLFKKNESLSEMGSNFLFRESVEVGYTVWKRDKDSLSFQNAFDLSITFTASHESHAGLFGDENRGSNDFMLGLNFSK